MKKISKIMTAAAAVVTVLAVSASSVSANEVFSDINEERADSEAIMKMYNAGYIAGYKDGSFRPDGSITRAELVRIVNQTLQFSDPDEDAENAYSDVYENEWYYNDLLIAQERDYVEGFPDGTFKPNDNITRQQFCTIVSRLFGFEAPQIIETKVEDEITGWATNYVYAVLSAGVMELEEGNLFRATENITRGEVCLAMSQFIIDEEIPEDSSVIETIKRRNSGGGSGSGSGSGTGSSTGSDSNTSSGSTGSDSGTSSGGSTGSNSGASSGGSTGSNSGTSSGGSTGSNSGTSSGGTSSGGTSSGSEQTKPETPTKEPVTESTTELTPQKPVLDEKTRSSLENVYSDLKSAQSKAPNRSIYSLIAGIRTNISNYLSDPSMDLDSAADALTAQYRALSADDRAKTQDLIIEACKISELRLLKDKFFPDLDM